MAASGRPFLQVEAQKLQQAHYLISIRSALRVISDSLAAPGFALLDAADRLMSGKSAATLTPINAFSVSIVVRQQHQFSL